MDLLRQPGIGFEVYFRVHQKATVYPHTVIAGEAMGLALNRIMRPLGVTNKVQEAIHGRIKVITGKRIK